MPAETSALAKPLTQEISRKLLAVWLDFERRLSMVPVIRRLEQGNFTLEDYQTLLRNLRPQVIEGARWISRAASSFTAENSDIRSAVLTHAVDEHRDYQLLERDYVAVSGKLEDIQSAKRNIGSDALAGYLMSQAGEPNPINLLGAMFIIEGLGNKMASKWAVNIQSCLGVDENATRFLSYHGHNDSSHIEKMNSLLESDLVTPQVAEQIVKTAKVVARLYILQLEELNNV